MDNLEPINESYETIKYYEHILTEYLTRLYTTGLTSGDYYDIDRIISSIYQELNEVYGNFTKKYGSRHKQKEKDINGRPKLRLHWSEEDIQRYKFDSHHMRHYTKKLSDLIYEYKKLQELLKEQIVGYTKEEFVQKEASLTHLVFTNQKSDMRIKPCSKNSFMFLCPIHPERTPSFSVDNMNRSGHCYGCGQILNPISFIEHAERLEEPEAIDLLASVYELNIPREFSINNGELIDKYRISLLDPRFKELLEMGYKRTEKYRHTSQVRLALDTYQRDLRTIERVRKSELLPYSNKEDLPKRLVLEFPFDHNK